jgi:carboxyl-terminal processing protease
MRKLTKRFYINMLGLLVLVSMSSAAVVKYFDVSKNLEVFTTLYKELNLYYVDETNPGELMKTGIDAMLESLDPYTVYYPESRIEDARFMQTGQYGGIGIDVESIDEKIIINEVLQGFPAASEGLKPGDEIISIDGQLLKELKPDQLDGLLKGNVGTSLSIEYRRANEQKEVLLSRAQIKINEVPYFGMINETDGYIKLTSFTKTSSMSVRSALMSLKSKSGAQRIVLDLRGNGGGLLREAVNIVGLFVDKGELVVSTKGKIASWNKVYETKAAPVAPDIPLIVLVDENSASASEIVSGALQDLDRAVVIGRQSFGKGLVQRTKDLVYNSKMKLTIAKYYIPSGRCIQRLDYSNKKDGKAKAVADSLIKPFETRKGRPVFDGRGVDPDVLIEKSVESELLKSLKTNYVLFDYVTDYAANSQKPDTVINFKYEDYDGFKTCATSANFDYSTASYQKMMELIEVTKKENYFTETQSEIGALSTGLAPNISTDLDRYKFEILPVLEKEIVKRLFFEKGEIQYSLLHDPYIKESVKTFNSNYSSILQ